MLYFPSKATTASKLLPCLLLNPLGLGMPFGEQVFDFIVGTGCVRFQPEHGRSALRVVAAYHLAVNRIPARATLQDTRSRSHGCRKGTVRTRPVRRLSRVYALLSLQGRCRRTVPRARYAPPPFSHSPVMANIGDAHRLDDGIEGSPFRWEQSFLQRSA